MIVRILRGGDRGPVPGPVGAQATSAPPVDDAEPPASHQDLHAHEATFGDAIVYFQYVWAGSDIPVHEVAKRLLDAGIAETVSSPVDGEVRMAPRYQELEAVRQDAQRLRDFNLLVGQQRWGTALRRHPGFTLRAWSVSMTSIASPKWRKANLSESSDSMNLNVTDFDSTPSVADASAPYEHGHSTDHHSRSASPSDTDESGPGDDSTARSTEEILDDVIRNITESVAVRQADTAVMHAREQDLYRVGYLLNEPYLRLTLRQLRFAVADTDNPAFDDGQVAPVVLLVHRSGVNQLLIPCRLPDGVSTSGVLTRLRSNSVELRWSELAEPILRPMMRRANSGVRLPWARDQMQLTGSWLPEVEEGVQWRHFDGGDFVLADVFTAYLSAIEEVVGYGIKGETWMSYPSVFLQPQCCTDEETFVTMHDQELNAVIVDHLEVRELRDATRLNIPQDRSILRDHSEWFTSAQATHVDWSDHESRRHFDSHLHTLLLVENFLLQMWQIRTLAAEVETAGRTRASPRVTQQTLIHGLTEFYESQLTFGTANDIVADLRQAAGVDRIHSHLIDRVDQLGSLTAAQRAEEAATRSSFVGLAAIAATALLAFPALAETFTKVLQLPQSGWIGTTSTPLRHVADQGEAGAWGAYLLVLALLVTLWCVLSLRLSRRRSQAVRRERRIKPAGIEWSDGTVEIQRVERNPRST